MATLQQNQIVQTLLHYRTVLVKSGLLITRDFHASEDIYQNLVIKALNETLEFESPSILLNWSRVVIRNEGIDWLKKNGREMPLEDARILDLLESEYLGEMKESRNLMAWSELLDDCLKKLNSESQRLLNLRYDGNRNCDEVARLMEISLESVYKRLSRIHLMLRDCVNTKAGRGTLSGDFINET